MFGGVKRIYEEKYRILLIIPFVLLLLAIAQIGYQQASTGSFLIKDISLKGGITLTVTYDQAIDAKEWESFLMSSGLEKGVLLNIESNSSIEGLREALEGRFGGETFKITPLEDRDGFKLDTSLESSSLEQLLEAIREKVDIADYNAEFITNLEFNVRTLHKEGTPIGFIIDTSLPGDRVDNLLEVVQRRTGPLEENQYSIEIIGSALGKSFFRETFIALIAAFVLMGIVVFFYFRVFIPSVAVILSALSDILVTVAITNLLHIRISTAGLAAFLMLIGYSVDTDILLSTHVLKRREVPLTERIYRAMRTGLMTAGTTLVAVTIALVFAKSDVISEIMLIVMIGLVVDLINTWIQNVGLLKWYMERNEKG